MASTPSEDEAREGSSASSMAIPHGADAAAEIVVPWLPLETRWPPFLLRQYAGFWLPEVTLKVGFPAVHSVFEPRPTDVFMASFPRSGATWLKSLAFATLNRRTHPPLAGDHPLRRRSPHDWVRFLEIALNTSGGEFFEALPSPRVLATHLPYTLLPGRITGNSNGGSAAGCRIVYVCRDPKDALVSYWLFTRKASPDLGVDAGSFTIHEAFDLFCEGRCACGPQWQHALEYWEESVRRPDRVLFLRYEEMLLEPKSHLRKLAKFMGCDFSDEEEEQGVVSAIVELCSLGKMKDMEVNNRNVSNSLGIKNETFFRKGVSGDWTNHLTSEMARRLDKIVEDALQGSGFTFATSR
ncbi:unnamed protein product [Urochloa decumbens]|uniref:Sulfotransferase n=1 Tax=Urochloa decumbens TaxID=240449 RepID=A0ABC8YM61_9POAL